MASRVLSALLLGSFILLPSWTAFAAPPTIELVVPDYEYPGEGFTNTFGRGIANNGTIVGQVTTPSFAIVSFERFADGQFSPTFAFPGAQATYALGANSSNLICGYYYTSSSSSHHGFFYDGVAFTQYDVPGATDTDVTGINDAGDFCGYYRDSVIGPETAFINVGDTLVTFTVPGANAAYARAVK